MAILPVLILSFSAMMMAFLILQNQSNFSAIYAKKSRATNADNIAQTIGAVIGNPNVCLDGFDVAAGGLAGMQFLPAAAGTSGTFLPALASTAAGQDVAIPNPLGGMLQNNTPVAGAGLTISRLYVANAVLDNPAVPGIYNMDLVVEYQSPPDGLPLAPRSNTRIQVRTAAGAVTGCKYAPGPNSNQALCTGMGCSYTVSPGGRGNCFCKIAPVTCANGTYVTSITGLTPQCSTTTIQKTCAPATNQFLVALDSSGNPVCATVDVCPAGTQTTGLGGVANPPSCRCMNVGETWNGTSCGVVVATNGSCGSANGGTWADAVAANGAGLCGAGTASPLALAGAGPWNWSCTGLNGGTNAACSASMGAAPPPPPACTYQYRVEQTMGSNAPPKYYDLALRFIMEGLIEEAGACLPTSTCDLIVSDAMIGEPCTVNNQVLSQVRESMCGPTLNWWCKVKCICPSAPPPPPPTACPTGSSTTGLGVAVNATCKCDNVSDTWDGAACSSTPGACTVAWSFEALLMAIPCPEGYPDSAAGSCPPGSYANTSSSMQCSGTPAYPCHACGPGSNIPAGICTNNPACP